MCPSLGSGFTSFKVPYEKKWNLDKSVPEDVNMNVVQSSLKVFRIVEYIKGQEFPFDTHDEPEEMLGYFGVDDDLNEQEREALVKELERLAEQAQTREISRVILDEAEEASRGWENGC